MGEWIPINCSLNEKNNDFLYPIVFNSIIERNLVVHKFSPQAGVLRSPAIYVFNANNIFVQVRKGDSLARLINLEIRNGGSTEDTRVNRGEQNYPPTVPQHCSNPHETNRKHRKLQRPRIRLQQT